MVWHKLEKGKWETGVQNKVSKSVWGLAEWGENTETHTHTEREGERETL